MSFCSVNELHKFSFEDCVVVKAYLTGGQVRFSLEAVRVKPDNSQNKNYTESYADTSELDLKKPSVLSLVKEGWRMYNADGVLEQEVPDETVPADAFSSVAERLTGAYLFSVKELPAGGAAGGDAGNTAGDNAGGQAGDDAGGVRRTAVLRFEIPPEVEFDTAPTESYELTVSFTDSYLRWDRYLNKVQS